ncbi:hypothetical protein LINPERHAP2_LOCUS34126, partial [Linum perenne]
RTNWWCEVQRERRVKAQKASPFALLCFASCYSTRADTYKYNPYSIPDLVTTKVKIAY